MTRADIAKDLRRHTGAGMITPQQLAAFLGVKAIWRVKEKYLKGLEHVGNRYLITEVAERIKNATEI